MINITLKFQNKNICENKFKKSSLFDIVFGSFEHVLNLLFIPNSSLITIILYIGRDMGTCYITSTCPIVNSC
jgi:hypothetical protein